MTTLFNEPLDAHEIEDTEALALLVSNEPSYQPDTVNVGVLKLLLSRLAQIMAQEVDMLEAMEISRLQTVQREKKALVDALEKQKKLLIRRNTLLDSVTEEEEEELRELVEVFEAILGENHKRLLIAKEVNARVVSAIADQAHESAKQSFYTPKGERAGDSSVCVSLNRSI